MTVNDAEHSIKRPLPIDIKVVLDFLDMFTDLIELMGIDNCICKSTVHRLKVQTKNP